MKRKLLLPGLELLTRHKMVLPGLVILVATFGAVALMATSPELDPDIPEPVAPTVRVLDVLPESIQLRVHSQGTVAPTQVTALFPEVAGRVVWISPALVNGGYFEKGTVLLMLDEQDYRSALQRAQAALTRAEAEHDHARYEHERMLSLEERQLASRSQMENTLKEQRVKQAVLEDARANFDQAQRDLERTEVRAPFNGLVQSESVDVGQLVGRNMSVATLYASDQVEVRLPIADRQLAFLNVPLGQRGALPEAAQPQVTLSAQFAGRTLQWSGRIVRTEAQIDTASRMVNVVARVNSSDHAEPPAVGLFVDADIEGLTVDDIVVLPRIALRNGNRVLVVDEEERLRFRDVEPLRLYQDDVLIVGGLEQGERVCVSPMQTPIEGMRVRPVADPDQAAT
ncbi:MAG: efflux RND transporter periplasmic adaptor subunit [Gammaproteobacteria bacterium]|nr:efflux RND transporter periplasmic adaptor subunit [Gammaproteobacteria bacterium]